MPTYVGTNGSDSPNINTTDDVLYGLDGNDILYFGTNFISYAYGGNGDDILDQLDNSGGYAEIHGDAGWDRIDGGSYFDDLYGDSGNDYITAWDNNDYVEGGTGSDALFGQEGNDTIYGGDEDDLIDGGNGADVIYGGEGNDSNSASFEAGPSFTRFTGGLYGGSGADYIDGGRGWDFLDGGVDADTLLGGEGNDTLMGGSGIDRMDGGSGNDLYYIDSTGDRVFEIAGQGSDTVAASTSHTLQAGQSIEVLQTTNTGGTGAISLAGNEIAQVIKGNNGTNVIYGRGGSDVLYGYGGADTFVFDTAPGASNRDTIMDFSHAADTIRLDKSVFAALTIGNLAASAFKDIGVAGAVVDANDRILYNSDTGALFYDANGSAAGGAVQFGTLLTRPADVSHLDFVIVA